MKKDRVEDADEILPEYDFSRARPNPYARRYASESNVVVLDPDVAAVFPNAAEVNDTLRAVAGIISRHKQRPNLSRRSASSLRSAPKRAPR